MTVSGGCVVFVLSASFASVHNGASGENCKAEEVVFQCCLISFVSQKLGNHLDYPLPLSVLFFLRMLSLSLLGIALLKLV